MVDFIAGSTEDLGGYVGGVNAVKEKIAEVVNRTKTYSALMSEGVLVQELFDRGVFDAPYPEAVAPTREDIKILVADLLLAVNMSASIEIALAIFAEKVEEYASETKVKEEKAHAKKVLKAARDLDRELRVAIGDLVEAEDGIPVFFSSGPMRN